MKTTPLASIGLALATSLAFGETLDTTPFTYRCEITFSGYAGASTLENFPALVRIPAGSDVYKGSGDGSDLRFADGEGNLIPHEINSWNRNGESLVWVRVPALAGKETKISLYCGGTPTQEVDSAEVWGAAGYHGVWHYEGSCADSSPQHLAFEDRCWPTSATKPTYTTDVVLGKGIAPGNTGYVVVANDAKWTAFPDNTLTVSTWMFDSQTNGGNRRAISCKYPYTIATGFEIHGEAGCTSFNTISSGNGQLSTEGVPKYNEKPIYVTVTFAQGATTIYANGKKVNSAKTTLLKTPEKDLYLCADADGGTRWLGYLDETRLQWAAPSEDWVAADYATQTAGDFAVLGKVEALQRIDETAFGKKCEITLPCYAGATVLFGFPVLVRLPVESGIAAYSATGEDIRFADEDGVSLPFDVETWSKTRTSLVWVRMAKLEGTETKITLYCDAKAELPAAPKASEVWAAAGYKGVWHFGDGAKDSSPNDLPVAATCSDVRYDKGGRIGSGFYGATGWGVEISNDVSWAGFSTGALTLSGWIKTTQGGGCYGRILSSKTAYSDHDGFELTMQNVSNRVNAIGTGNNQHVVTLKNDLEFMSDYVYVTAVYSNGVASIYANGEFQGTDAKGDYRVYSPTNRLTIGKNWRGYLDELRLQWAVQSPDWIKADYDTQKDPETFAVLGSLVDVAAEPLDPANYRRRAKITFSGYTGKAPLVNFPALVRIPKGSPITRSPGARASLRFADAANTLIPHEIERWDSESESLVWVRVPRIEGTESAIYAYYGAVNRAKQPAALSPREVWRPAGYHGVWHFAGTADDSSACAYATEGHNITYATFGPLGQAFQSSADGEESGAYAEVKDRSIWNGFDGAALTITAWIHNTLPKAGFYDRIVSTKRLDYLSTGFEVTRQNQSYRLNSNGNRGAGDAQHVVDLSKMSPPHDLCTETLYATFIFENGKYTTFINGELAGSMTAPVLLAPTNTLTIGRIADNTWHQWHGQLDEIRLQWAVPNEDWIKADYDTQRSDGAFAVLGEVERLRETGGMVIVR